MMGSDDLRRLLKAVAVAIVVAVALELTLFNINHWRSLAAGAGTEVTLEASAASLSSADDTLTFDGIDQAVSTVTVTFGADQPQDTAVSATYSITDDGTSAAYVLPVTELLPSNERSLTSVIDPYGDLRSLTISIKADSYPVHIASVILNRPVPLSVDPLRMLVVALVIVGVWLLRPHGLLARTSAAAAPARRIRIAVLVCALVVIGATTNYGSDDQNRPWYWAYAQDEYTELAHSLTQGRLYLDEEPPDWLVQMEDPYDPAARTQAEAQTGISFKHDAAYHDGHYYVYFGVVPEVVLFLPFYVLTGLDLPNSAAVGLAVLAFAGAVWTLLSQLVRTRFTHASLQTFVLVFLGVLACSGIVYSCGRPCFYNIPVTCGLAFAMWGLVAWHHAVTAERHKGAFYALGALLMALVAGCRPQVLVVGLLALPLLWRAVRREAGTPGGGGGRLAAASAPDAASIEAPPCVADTIKVSSGRVWLVRVAQLGIPVVVVVGALLWYNVARFGSPLDFGSAYNLADDNLTLRGHDVIRALEGAFYLLFQPSVITSTFPFLQAQAVSATYGGLTISEPVLGGIVATAPFALVAPVLLLERRCPRREALLAGALVVLAVVVCLFDVEGAGILTRYVQDFGVLLGLASALMVLARGEGAAPSRLFGLGLLLVVVACLAMVVLARCGMMTDAAGAEGARVDDWLWERIRLAFMFWA
ncbi:MAG: hypothetical protein PHR15_07335 [Atopobiaceae bacterium]|jgi:hypothetical protein|nr:hypothetical protein [Atopobiaceae bacterium]MCH4230513.1 hypothetical protein [Atopobiaceae bacterium]MCI1226782.1 hypothetical protein [Atopobiaceae bacterium]MCI1259610.1 hypothetical protein [Atopobiaceae bacterium]MDD2588943.1 hypothetical protein [Atopobiaceae bacterium]